MIYSEVKCKGVKKKGIPPCEIELPLAASYNEVLQAGKDNFFEEEEDISIVNLTLADSSGTRIKVRDRAKWTIGDFFPEMI